MLAEVVKRVVGRPVPARAVWALSRTLPGDDALVTPPVPAGAEAIADAFLRDRLAGRELGTWALSARAIDLLVRTVRRHRPQLAVEFSSGVSTLALAHAMRPLEQAPWVISIEQDADHAEATRAMLDDAGLGDAAVVLHAPLVQTDGRSAYDLDAELLAGHIAGRTVGIVVVDGPAAEPGARVTTLPALCPHLRAPCPLLLDDALRDGELYAARAWLRDGLIESARYDLAAGGLMAATALPCRSR